MKILLTGASGFVGTNLMCSLQKKGHTVVACSHKKKIPMNAVNNTHHQQIQIDFMQMHKPEDWFAHLNKVDVVINTVGIIAETKRHRFEQLHTRAPVSLFKACKQKGIKRVIQISALGADKTAITPYHLSKKSADDALRKMDLDWFILRPSLIEGEGGASYELFKKLSNLPIIALFGDGKQLIQPINIQELSTTVLRCLDNDVAVRQTIDLVGEQSISYKNWMISLRTRPYPARFLSLPIPLMMQLAKVGKYINLALLNPDSFIMLQQNNVASRRGLDTFLNTKKVELGQAEELAQ